MDLRRAQDIFIVSKDSAILAGNGTSLSVDMKLAFREIISTRFKTVPLANFRARFIESAL